MGLSTKGPRENEDWIREGFPFYAWNHSLLFFFFFLSTYPFSVPRVAIQFGQSMAKYIAGCVKSGVTQRLNNTEFKALLTFMSDETSTTTQLDFTVADQDEVPDSGDVGEGEWIRF